MGDLNLWSTKIPLNNKKFQKILFLFIFVFSTQKCVYSQQKHQPSIKLVEPIARLLENGPVAQRLPETTCPTPSTEKDPINNVLSGIQFRVRWHDPGHLPVELAKLELFSSDAGGHLLSRLDIIKDEKKGMIDTNSSFVSMMAQIPEGLRCNLCTLRLSVELDERIQLVSCAQVSVKPAEKVEKEEEKECKEDKECLFGGSCFDGNCFCSNGRFGEQCKNENPPPTKPSFIQNSESLQSIKFPESGIELKWLANPDKNLINLGLTFDEEKKKEAARWFILGIQSTESDKNCRVAVEKWQKQKLMERSKTRAKAGGGPLVRVEQEKGENALNIDSTEPSNINQIPSINKSSTTLNIKKLNEGNTNKSETEKILSRIAIEECDTNQRWEQCPDSERECEPSCEWTAFPESIPVCPARTSEQKCGKPRCVCVEGFVRLGKNLNECKPFSFCQAPEATSELTQEELKNNLNNNENKEKQQKCPKNEIWEKCGNACEPSCQSMYSEEPCSSVCEMPGCTCTDNFVRLSVGGPCIEWTECPNLKERNEPKNVSVTVTSKTPQIGRLQCGANETINECGTVCEADCLSIFEREECHNCGKPACACRQGYARSGGKCIYWGDCPAVNSLTTTTIQPEIKNNKKSTNLQELKESPHKHSGQVEIISTTQKITTIEPSMDICKGQWKWPKGCGIGDKKCHYSIEWFLDQNSDSLQFQLETIPAVYRKIQKEEPIWSGIGFSPSGTLLDADMIVIGTLDQRKGSEEIGKLEIMDMHVDEKLEQFRPDSQQDIILQEGIFNYTDGVFKAKFSRKRRTGDSAGEDLDFGEEDGNCVRFLFPISGGRFEKNGNISVPVADSLYASDAEICVRNCKDKNINELPSSNLPTPHSCLKEFKWPANCKLENCEYRASWEWEKKDDTVLFNISSRGIGRWTGIGFSKDGKMAGSDIITGWFYDQKPYLTDRFAFAQQQPAIDPVDRQDIFDIGGALNDDIQTISFRRKVVSLDKSTDLSLAECVHFLFPVQGGRVLAHSSRDFQQARTPIGFHDQQQPISSPTQICLCDRPINFKNPEREQIGRIRRIRNIENEEEFKQNGLPFQCADIAIIQIAENSNKLLIRAIDAFGLSNDSLRRDEHWGGQQSFNGVEVFNNSGKNTIWLTKMLKDQTNSNGDLTIQQGQIQVFLSTGHGIKPEISQAEKLEFALIDLMAGVGKENIQNTKLKHQTTTTSIFTSLPTTPNTPENITEIIKTFSSVSPKQQKVKEASSEMENSEENVEGDKEIEKKVEEEAEKEEEPNEEQLNKEDEEESSSPPELSKTSILTDENCFGGFAYPEDCMQLTSNGNIKQCQYMLQWMVIPELTKVIFQLNVRMPSNHWTGVGFSNDGSMTNSDAIIAILGKDGRIIVQDRFSPNYDKPVLDTTQNIEEISSRSVDGLWALNFSRSLYTQDDLQDADLRQCQHFIFLHTANPLTSGSEEMKKHIKTPIISENMICLGKCGQKLSSTMATNDVSIDVLIDESTTEKQQETTTSLPTTLITTRETEETTQTLEITFAITETTEKQTEKQTSEKTTTPTIPSTPSPEQEKNEDEQMDKNLIEEKPEIVKQQNVDEKYKKKIFNVAIKLPNEKWDAKLGEPESEEFSLMSQKLRNSLQSLISIRWPSLQMINVQKFAEGSVLALLQMTFNTTLKNNEELPTTKQLKHFLKEAAAQKMPAELVLDSEMLEVQENEEEGEINDNEIGEEKEKIASAGQWQGWLLAVLGTFMLLSIATALLFCAFRNRKHQRQHQTYPTKHHSSLHRHNQNNLRTNTLFFNGSANNYNQSHYIPFPGEKEDRASENSTTAKTNNSGGESCNNVPNGVNKQQNKMETPRGIGEASYREWFKKVASKDTPTHYQENYWQIPPPTPLPRSASHGGLGHGGQQTPVHAPSASPYLSYPNDPTYYTLNGEHRIVPPPPAYYRPF